MPWTVDDVERHNKGLSASQKKTWVEVANGALSRCMARGKMSQKECEASAIRQANAVVARKDVGVRMIKAIDEKQIVYGVVYEPDMVDAHNEFASAEDIEDAAHGYMVKLQNSKGSRLKLSHDVEIDKYADIVESYIAPCDLKIGKEDVKKGSWIVAIKIWHSELWKATKDEIQGLSMGGTKTFVE